MTTMKKFALLAATIALGTASNAFAFQFQWKGGSNSNAAWSTSADWKPLDGGSTYPQAGDIAIIDTAVTVIFTSGIPGGLDELRVNHSSAVITLQPGSSATLTVPVVTVTNGSLKFDTNQPTTVSTSISVSNSASLVVDAAMTNSGTISLANTASMTVNAALTNSGAITVPSGTTFDATANVTNSSNPTLTINSGGIMKFRNGADLLGTATLANAGRFHVIDGLTEIASTISISGSGEFRVELVSSGSPELKFNGTYTSHAFTVRLMDTSSVFNVANAGGISTSGDFCSPYGTPCNGKSGTGTFSWSGNGCVNPSFSPC